MYLWIYSIFLQEICKCSSFFYGCRKPKITFRCTTESAFLLHANEIWWDWDSCALYFRFLFGSFFAWINNAKNCFFFFFIIWLFGHCCCGIPKCPGKLDVRYFKRLQMLTNSFYQNGINLRLCVDRLSAFYRWIH